MSTIGIRIAIVVLATAALSAAACAAPSRGGGGGHGGGGGGGHGGGGGMHAGGGGMRGGGGGGMRGGGGGGARFSGRAAVSRSYARPSSGGGNVARSTFVGNRSAATGNPAGTARFNVKLDSTVKSNAVRETLNSHLVAGALRSPTALRNPGSRARITASAATAGWHNGRDGAHGWWRHGNGGYGWVGPLYWPFAYNDMYDYGMWGNGYDDSFWGYGYDDIYAGLFAPYGYDDLTGYLPQAANPSPGTGAPALPAATATTAAPTSQLAQMCGQDSRDIAGLPIAQFQQAIQPTDAQRAALDDLANASLKAAQDIKAACPTDIALTAPNRLAAMQQRIQAMITAVATIQPPLETFYGLLSDEQKVRLAALASDQLKSRSANKTASSSPQTCGAAQPGVTEWPTADIQQAVHPTDAQRASLVALQDASAKSAEMLKASCLTDDPLTPPARFTAVGKRLETMLQAVTLVRSALNDFYGSLTDEQKVHFEAIGPKRTSQLESLDVTHIPARRYGGDPVGQIIRRLMPFGF